jgi:L-lactate dehydrogenase complex protein LldG
MDRQAFLARVREAARQGAAYRVATQDLPADVGYVGAGDDPPGRLAAEIEAVGGRAYLVEDLAAARQQLAAIVKQRLPDKQPASALCWQHPLLDKLELAALLRASGVEPLSYRDLAALPAEEQRRCMLSADLGIASADFAVAETGTLAVASAPGRERSVTLLPPVLIQIVDSSQIVPDLLDLFNRTEDSTGQSLPSNLTLITGPSKTGDIELQLTTGVHGPGEWHVIIVRKANEGMDE